MRCRALAFAMTIAAGCNFTQHFELPPAKPLDNNASEVLPDRAPCADVESDPNNCGDCGHSCLGGPCNDGRCGAVILVEGLGSTKEVDAAGESGPTAIAADETHAYWLDDQGTALMRVPVGGGPATRVASVAATKLVVTADAICAGGHAGISRIRKSDGVVTRAVVPAGYIVDFTISSDTLFFVVQSERRSEIHRCADLECTSFGAPIFASEDGELIESIEAAGAWLFAGLYAREGGRGRLQKLDARTGARAAVLGLNAEHYGHLRADATSVFSSSFRYIIRSPLAPNPDSSATGDKYIVSGEDVRVQSVISDGDFIYWHEPWGPRRIVRCAKTGCLEPEVLWSSVEGAQPHDWWGTLGAPDGAEGLAVNDEAIFFTTRDGKVMRLAKPKATKVTTPTP